MLRLIRATKSRPSGTWSDDDYDVFDGGQHMGRVGWSCAASGVNNQINNANPAPTAALTVLTTSGAGTEINRDHDNPDCTFAEKGSLVLK